MAKSRNIRGNIILFAGLPGASTLGKIKSFVKKNNYKIASAYDNRKKVSESKKKLIDILIPCSLKSDQSLKEAFKPYREELKVVTCRGEVNIPLFQKIIPHLPYLRTPSTESLEWTTNKILMRKHLKTFDKKITPKFTVVKDSTKKSLKEIEKKVGFPLVLKPSGLAESLLVSIAYHPEELQSILKKTFRKLNKVYREVGGRGEPQVLVEQFMDGDMYSVDAHVTSRGKIYFNQIVDVVTGADF